MVLKLKHLTFCIHPEYDIIKAIMPIDPPEIERPQSRLVSEPDFGPVFYPPDSPEVKDLLRNHRIKIDYASMWPTDTPVMFIGETHGHRRNITEVLTQIIPQTKTTGVTHFALEMVQEEDQKTLASYLNGQISKPDFSKALEGWDEGGGQSTVKNYVDLIDGAHKSNLKVIGLDNEKGEQHTVESLAERNRNWVKILKGILLNEPGARMLVYCGGDHARYDFPMTANTLLEEEGIKSVVVHLIHGTTKWRNGDDLDTAVAVTAIDDEDTNYKRFGLDFRYMGDKRPIDYAVHLPFIPNQLDTTAGIEIDETEEVSNP